MERKDIVEKLQFFHQKIFCVELGLEDVKRAKSERIINECVFYAQEQMMCLENIYKEMMQHIENNVFDDTYETIEATISNEYNSIVKKYHQLLQVKM